MPLTTAQLPVRLTPLVGRERELDEIVQAVTRNRMLTLAGPGGTGKTRLALAAARAAGDSFPAGVGWVELAQVEDAGLVGQAVAARLGVPDAPGQDLTEALAAHIGDSRLLVVLDNCEHLAGAVALLTENLLAACAALTVLTTSREALGVEGELNWRVPPLSLPRAGPRPTASGVASSDAVKLFEQRAQLVRPSFRVTDDNAAQVATICQRLDGLPLAIELAAARMRILTTAELAERLDDIFTVLVGGARSAPPRHQALRATLDWSHEMLDQEERTVFRRLAVFSGGFTLEAAEHVAAGRDIKPASMLELLTRLADKSLLRVEHTRGGESRYHLLATIHDYARLRLAETAESQRVRRAHLAYFTELAETAAARIEGVEAGATGLEYELNRLDVELPNLRRAFEVAHSDPVAALRIVGPLDRYAYLRGRYHEIRQWMDEAVTSYPDAPAEPRAKVLLGSGRLALLQCDYAPAVRRLEAALRLYRELGDPRGIAAALQVLGSVSREQGRYARAVELHAESLATAEAAGDRRAVASAHGYLAFVSWLQRDFGRATEEAEASLAMFRELGDVEGAAWALISLGTIARYQGESERASALLTEARSLSEAIGFREGIAWCCEQLGLLAAVDGDPAAISLLRCSLDLHGELRDRWRLSSVLEDLAAIALALDRARAAARLLGAAEAIRDAIGTVVAPCERPQHVQSLAAARGALGEEAFEAARQEGMAASVDELTGDLPSAEDAAPALAQPAQAAPAQTGPAQAPPAQAGPAEAPLAQTGPAEAPPAQTGPAQTGPAQAAPAQAAPAQAGPAEVKPVESEPASAPAEPPPRAPVPRPRAPQATARNAAGPLQIKALGSAVVEFGTEALTAADWGYAKPRELMFLLASSPPLTKDQIAAALWPDLSRQQLGNALHTALRELRRALGDPGWVVYANGHYRFDRSRAHECDVTEFEDALVAARRARPAEAALPELQRAIGAYGGDFLDGMPVGEWALVRRDELRRAFESALLATGRMQTAAGRHQAAAALFRRAVAHEPLNETAHRELMNCWARLGETARAVRHYEELTALLREQVGVPPAPETTALYRRLTASS